MSGGFIISNIATAAFVIGILFFTGWGIALNADHIPFNLNMGDLFKNNPGNNDGTNGNNQQPNTSLNTQKSANNEQKNNLKDNNGENSKTTSDSQANSQENTQDNSNSNGNEISSSEAQSTAQKYIEEPGTNAGNPQKVDIGGKNTYVVPVESDGKTVGEIHIDPETGENVGGAGGAP
ncbi:MAG: hypothetical protein ACPK7O_10320 [Methanobacterium sp.]